MKCLIIPIFLYVLSIKKSQALDCLGCETDDPSDICDFSYKCPKSAKYCETLISKVNGNYSIVLSCASEEKCSANPIAEDGLEECNHSKLNTECYSCCNDENNCNTMEIVLNSIPKNAFSHQYIDGELAMKKDESDEEDNEDLEDIGGEVKLSKKKSKKHEEIIQDHDEILEGLDEDEFKKLKKAEKTNFENNDDVNFDEKKSERKKSKDIEIGENNEKVMEEISENDNEKLNAKSKDNENDSTDEEKNDTNGLIFGNADRKTAVEAPKNNAEIVPPNNQANPEDAPSVVPKNTDNIKVTATDEEDEDSIFNILFNDTDSNSNDPDSSSASKRFTLTSIIISSIFILIKFIH